MKNLKTYGIQELSSLETTEIKGGDWIAELGEPPIALVELLEEIVDRLQAGWDSYGDCSCDGD